VVKVELRKANVWEGNKRERESLKGTLRRLKKRQTRVFGATTLGLENQVRLKASSTIQAGLIYY